MTHPEKVKPYRIILSLILLVTAVAFHRAVVTGYFDWDDKVFISENGALDLPPADAAKTIFTKSYLYDYLPLTIMSYWAENKIVGRNPFEMHAVNLALHLTNIVLLFVFLSLLGLDKNWTLVICAVFGFHPVQTETLMWTSCRNTIMATLFLLIASIAHQRADQTKTSRSGDRRRRNAQLAVMNASFILAFLCKATGLLYPFVLACADVVFHHRKWKPSLMKVAPAIALMVVASLLRALLYASGAAGIMATAGMFNPERLVRMPFLSANAFAEYVRMFVWPFHYSLIYPTFVMGVKAYVLFVLVLVGLTGLALLYRRMKDREMLFFAVFVFAFLLPILHIFPRSNYINDRYMYLPVVGFAGVFLTASRDLKQVFANRASTSIFKFARWLGIAFLISLPFFSLKQSLTWRNEHTLWENVVQTNPASAFSRNKFAQALINEGHFEEAIQQYEVALRLPTFDTSPSLLFADLGSIYLNPLSARYDPERAVNVFRDGLKYAYVPEHTYQLRFNLAVGLFVLHKDQEGLDVLSELRRDLARTSDQRYSALLIVVDQEIAKARLRLAEPRSH